MDLLLLVKGRLASFGIEADDVALSFAAGKTEEKIRNFCNVAEIPDGLAHATVDMVCGEYLHQMHRLGKLDAEMFPADAAVKSIDEGDVKIAFMDHASAEDKLAAFIGYLLDHETDLLAFRRLRW